MSTYAKLGTQCEPQTMSSLTSNAKYILPLNSVYHKNWTTMLNYPGMDNFYENDKSKFFGKFEEPEHVKAFKSNSKDSNPDQEDEDSKKSCNC